MFRCTASIRTWRLATLLLLAVVSTTMLYFRKVVSEDRNIKQYTEFFCKNEAGSFTNEAYYCYKAQTIFFLETSGRRLLNERQACAIESAARVNPSMTTMVLMTGSFLNTSDSLTKAIIRMDNVFVKVIDLDEFLRDSPLWTWYKAGQWKRSQWKVNHLSDALRLFALWKCGGIYLDLDTVSLRSMEHLSNVVVTENWERLANGILVFDRGNEMLCHSMIDFVLHYDWRKFLLNGPQLLAKNIKKYCNTEDLREVSDGRCGLTIIPPETAFPIPYEEWKKYFTSSDVKDVASHFNTSYLIHVWNKFSYAGKLIMGENSIYETAMKQHCPIVYSHAKKRLFI